jgi:isoquinoline 1-oxidoreductase subunit alpha
MATEGAPAVQWTRDSFRHSNKGTHMVQFKVNGVERSFDGDPEMPLLWYLRDTLGLTGTKFGCGMALCGACTVHEKGSAIRSCTKQMGTMAGADITTIEAISAQGPHAVQKVWIETSVPQCGYCQPGQIMQAVSLLHSKPNPTDDDIDASMSGNICRCGTYQRIRAAIKEAAKVTA